MLDDYSYELYTLQHYVEEMRFGPDFLNKYLIPMSSAVWLTPADTILQFPAVMVMRFFQKQGFLGWDTQRPWRTVTGGGRMYRDKIIEPFKNRLKLKTPAVRVTRREGAVQVIDSTGDARSFDHVIIATHADEALALLSNPTAEERALLSQFPYQKNIATLHTDSSVMPKKRSAWSSWNYRAEIDRGGRTVGSTIYWMNSIQGISPDINYFVSINDPGNLIPIRVLKRIEYEHPLFSLAAVEAQKKLPQLNANGLVYFCGSYFGCGSHEDALAAAISVCKTVQAA